MRELPVCPWICHEIVEQRCHWKNGGSQSPEREAWRDWNDAEQCAWFEHASMVVRPLMRLEKFESGEIKFEWWKSNDKLKCVWKWKQIGSILARELRLILGFEIWDFSKKLIKNEFWSVKKVLIKMRRVLNSSIWWEKARRMVDLRERRSGSRGFERERKRARTKWRRRWMIVHLSRDNGELL